MLPFYLIVGPMLLVILCIVFFVRLGVIIGRMADDRRMQFSLRGVLITMTLAAMILGVAQWLRGYYYWQLDNMHEVLASHPEIIDVQIVGNDDVWYEVEVVYFSIAGNPKSRIEVRVPHAAGKWEMRQIVDDALKGQNQ